MQYYNCEILNSDGTQFNLQYISDIFLIYIEGFLTFLVYIEGLCII